MSRRLALLGFHWGGRADTSHLTLDTLQSLKDFFMPYGQERSSGFRVQTKGEQQRITQKNLPLTPQRVKGASIFRGAPGVRIVPGCYPLLKVCSWEKSLMNKGDLCKPRAGEMARLVKVLATKSDDPGIHIEKTDYSKLSSDFLTPSPYPM